MTWRRCSRLRCRPRPCSPPPPEGTGRRSGFGTITLRLRPTAPTPDRVPRPTPSNGPTSPVRTIGVPCGCSSWPGWPGLGSGPPSCSWRSDAMGRGAGRRPGQSPPTPGSVASRSAHAGRLRQDLPDPRRCRGGEGGEPPRLAPPDRPGSGGPEARVAHASGRTAGSGCPTSSVTRSRTSRSTPVPCVVKGSRSRSRLWPPSGPRPTSA